MPHITIEKSKNVQDNINCESFFKEAIDSMVENEIIPNPYCVKCRTIKLENDFLYNESDIFIHIKVDLLAGRAKEKLQLLGKSIKALIEKHAPLSAKSHPNCFSVEVREMDKEIYQK